MNPFDLTGPQFLLFYSTLGILVVLALVLVRRSSEMGMRVGADITDPYLIAYLRGEKNETLRVAALSLLDRGLLVVREDLLVQGRPDAAGLADKPIEKMIVEKYRSPGEPSELFEDKTLAAACEEYAHRLSVLGALPNENTQRARLSRFLAALLVLGGVAIAKVAVAFGRGRHNVLFLILLALLFVFLAGAACFRTRTARGDAVLADLRTLFSSLKQRASRIRPGQGGSEAALLAAVFGLSALPAAAFAHAKKLKPRVSVQTGCGATGGCGSSCGSSCGGGGCGGGCGGCGG